MDQNDFLSREFDALLGKYRDACPDPEPGCNFLPVLWEGIERRRSFTFRFRRMSRALVTAAAAICALVTFLWLPAPTSSLYYATTYLEILADDDLPETLAYDPGAGVAQ